MNTWNVSGRLIKDPEVASSVCKLCLSVGNSALDENKKPTSSLFNFTAFGKTGEMIAKYFKKGSTIELSASVRHNTYKNKEGVVVTTTEFYVERVDFPPKPTTESGGGEKQNTKTQAKSTKAEPSESIEDDEEFPF